MKWFKYLSLGAYVVGWLERATKDDVITHDEMIELVTTLLTKLDLDQIKIKHKAIF